ncbi:cytochrome c oxidase assembly protein [Planctomonas deserti]|uniref:cytochrome c oxidase assembly protein n=1 Tax=Planctomonas deserti TaxID=2144185 RepID=UPI001F0C2978|nr:cytochrome c oxidase assembly protein [Planctomonas deserti]
MHDHAAVPLALVPVVWVAAALAAAAYLGAIRSSRRRGRWPFPRTAAWLAGVALAAGAVHLALSPVGAGFVGHMTSHLLLGMLAPLLLVLAAPGTLALRSLPVVPARRLSAVLRSGPVRVLTHPVPAVVLNVGGLWLLYATPLYGAMHANPLLLAAVHAHVFAAGYLFTFSIAGPDPAPHRPALAVRAVVLLAAIAGHSVLAKYLYAHPPAGVSAADAATGSQLMYYGGDAIELCLIVALGTAWYRSTRPRPQRRPRPGAVVA